MRNPSTEHSRILIVEDEGVVASDIEKCLEDAGFEVSGVAASADDAIAEVERGRPDLVLMDIRIQGALDGVDAAGLLHRRFGLPIVYLTAHGDPDTLERAKETAPLAFLLKPFRQSDLISTIEIALGRAHAEVREREQWFALAMDSIGDAVWFTDASGRIRFLNRAAEQLTGCPREAALERPIEEVVDGADECACLSLAQLSGLARDDLKARDNSRSEFCVVTREGESRWVLAWSISGLDSDTGPGRVVVMQEITGRKRAEEALARQAEELARSNTELQQFAYIVSHDLQEPLRSISNFAGILGQRYRGQLDADADTFIGFVVDGAKRMHNLINDLLAYSRVTRSRALRPTDCESVLADTLANLATAIEQTGGAVTHDPLPVVEGDGTLLGQVFQNLIGNALKFHSAQPPRIHVSAERLDGKWCFSVRDNGIGIDPQYAEEIFLIFRRLHGSEKYSGTGIGLAVAKKIVDRHGGRIWVKSEPGQGSTFYFTIPIR